MKKFLLATTALIAASAFAGLAHAADAQGVRLGLGGYYKGAVGSIIEDDVNQLAAVGFAPNTR
ncbi:MAG: hypothetical protein AB7U41_02960, partial [Dongiaceae bacterium]